MLVFIAVELDPRQAQKLLDRFCNNFHTARTLASVVKNISA